MAVGEDDDFTINKLLSFFSKPFFPSSRLESPVCERLRWIELG